MWSDWLVFCECGFQSVCPRIEKDKRLMEDSLREGDWLRGKLHLVLMGGAILSKSLIQFPAGGSLFPLCYLTWDQTMLEVYEENDDLLQNSHAHTSTLSAPTLLQVIADPHLCWILLDTHGQVWVSLLWGHCSFLLSPGVSRFCLCPPRVCLPVLCKF